MLDSVIQQAVEINYVNKRIYSEEIKMEIDLNGFINTEVNESELFCDIFLREYKNKIRRR